MKENSHKALQNKAFDCFYIFLKNMLTKGKHDGIINKFRLREQQKNLKNKSKKLLTNTEKSDMISKLLATGSKKNEKNFLKKVKKVLDKVKTT